MTVEEQTKQGGVDIKQAVRTARDFIGQLYPDQPLDLRLEEVELSDGREYWLVTYSFTQAESPDPRNPLQAIISPQRTRNYKVVKVDRDSGEALAMKIRTP
jgi:hypothetical protein